MNLSQQREGQSMVPLGAGSSNNMEKQLPAEHLGKRVKTGELWFLKDCILLELSTDKTIHFIASYLHTN